MTLVALLSVEAAYIYDGRVDRQVGLKPAINKCRTIWSAVFSVVGGSKPSTLSSYTRLDTRKQ